MLEDDILNEIKKNEEENKNKNEIVEIDENEEITNTQYDMPEVTDPEDGKKKKKKEKKPKGPSKWSQLSKKQKVTMIVCGVILLLVIVVILLYFLVFKKDDEEENKKPEEPVVIVEKDNYRYEDGWLVFLGENDEELGEYECTNKDEELCYVAYYSNEDDFDVNKNVYENGIPVEFRSDIILDNYVFIYDNTETEDGNVLLYNIESKEVTD